MESASFDLDSDKESIPDSQELLKASEIETYLSSISASEL